MDRGCRNCYVFTVIDLMSTSIRDAFRPRITVFCANLTGPDAHLNSDSAIIEALTLRMTRTCKLAARSVQFNSNPFVFCSYKIFLLRYCVVHCVAAVYSFTWQLANLVNRFKSTVILCASFRSQDKEKLV